MKNVRVDLKIGFQCNNWCAFCVQGDKRKHVPPKDMETIERLLSEGRKRGATGVVLTGGEPTLHEHFLDTLRLAKRLGYESLQVQTNGRRFCYPDFCRKAVAAGATEVSPALHGSTAALHEFLTGAPGSFMQTVAGIRNLKRLGVYVLTNTVITRANFRDLPDLARLFVKLGVDQFQFAFVHITGRAAENASWIVPRKALIEPWVKRGIDIGKAARKSVLTEAIPYCRMRGYEAHVAERIIPETTVYDAEVTIDSYTKYRMTEGKGKGPKCRACKWFKTCEGPWREYPELYGWEEFEPVAR
ncbi:MAG: radical SAM protein [Elusimicrobiota bacterium]